MPPTMPLVEIGSVACLGTGTMGHGVAFLAAKAGYSVRMFGRTQESLAKGFTGIDRAIALYEDNGLMSRGEGEALKSRVSGVTRLEEAADGAGLVMESIAEDLDIKQKSFALVERHCRPDAILATNTSSLSLSAIASALARPERFLSIHFFSPPCLMTPAEVSPVAATLPRVRELAAKWVSSIGKVPIVLETEVQGFIVNRVQAACLREALHIVEQGWASAETVDTAITLTLGRRYSRTGPLESADMGGLDIFNSVLTQLSPVLCDRTDAGPLIANSLANHNLGLKSGKGFYDWTPEATAARRAAREQSLIAFMKSDVQDT